jgi:type IV pilus assembly protein PilC
MRDHGVNPSSVGVPHADTVGDAGIPEADLCVLLRQLAAMLESGTPMFQALNLLADESRLPWIRRVLVAVANDVAEGIPLSDAMGTRPRAFGPIVVALVRAGERSGDLPGTLRQLAEQREGIASVARRTASLLIYPGLVALFAFCLVGFLFTFIVPKFVALFKELGVRDFPLATLVLMRISGGFPLVALALGLALFLAILFYVLYRRTTRGRLVLDYFSLAMPGVGSMNLVLALARVSGALSIMLERGVPVVQALRLAGEAAGNRVVAAALRRGERAVSEGRPLADGLRDAHVLPESFLWRVGVGEASGAIADAFRRLSQFYMDTAYVTSRAVMSILEPLLVILLGLLVGFIIISLFLPLISVVGSLSSS